MTTLHLSRPALLRGAALTLATSLALVAPQAASAKTFVARMKDKSGDAKNESTDITKVRVAYNRKSGAISITLTTKGDIDASNDDGIVRIVFSDLKNGKCQKATMVATAVLSVPGVAIASTFKNGTEGKVRYGTSQIESNELSMRIKHKSFSGKTPGCTYAAIVTNADKAEDVDLIDETNGNDGFAS